MKSTLHMHFIGPGVPIFHPLHSAISRSQDIAHFEIVELTHMLKIQTATKLLTFDQKDKEK